MKNKKMIKLVASLTIIFASTSASAQWVTFSPQEFAQSLKDSAQRAAEFIQNQAMLFKVGQSTAGTTSAVQGVQKSVEVLVQQQDQKQYSDDARARIARGQAEIAKRDFESLPKIEVCVEASKKGANKQTLSGMSFVNSGGTGAGAPQKNRLTDIKNMSAPIIKTLEDKQKLGTCSRVEVGGNVAGCTAQGAFSGADVSSKGFTQNTESGTIDEKAAGNPAAARDTVNYSLSEKGWDVARKNINDTVYYAAPGLPSDDVLKKNPMYKGMYDTIVRKLSAAEQSLLDIAVLVRGTPLSESQKPKWEKDSKLWKDTFPGLKKPENPSYIELLRMDVYKNYFTTTDDSKSSDVAVVAKNTRDMIAVTNVLLYEQLKAQHNNNIMMAHLLTQMVTPAKIDAVQAEFARIK